MISRDELKTFLDSQSTDSKIYIGCDSERVLINGKWSDIWFQGVSWTGITGLEPGTTTYDGYYSRNCARCGKIQHKKDPVKRNLTKSDIMVK